MPKTAPLWAELEREAHRVVLGLVERQQPVNEAELIASRILLARADITASQRETYLELLADVIRKYAELLARS